LLWLLALVILTQAVQGVHELVRLTGQREDLQLLHASQDRALEEVKKVRAQLEALAGGTARLADQGNPNARALVEKLKAQGIGLKAPASP
jgi:hypothetical protein